MNERRIIAETNQSAGSKLLWSILAGIGLGIGFLIVNKVAKQLEKKRG